MASKSLLSLRFDPGRLIDAWDRGTTREELVSSIVVAVVSALLFSALGLLWIIANVALVPAWSRALVAAMAAVLTLGYCTVRFRPLIATALGFVLALQLGSLFGAATGYLVYSAGADFPLIDAELYSVDRTLGFDWYAMLRWFADYPLLVKLTRVAYDQAGTQIAFIFLTLILVRQHDRLMKLVTAQFLALLIVHVIAIFLPAIGAYGYLGLSSADHPGMALTSEGHTVAQVMQLRSGELFDLSTARMMGLITFPSFHTVLALQSAWAFWQVRVLRWPAAAFNFLVWVGTLLHGSHHLTDTIAGAAVAIFGIYAAHRLTTIARRQMFGEPDLVQSPKST
ncbi:MAG: hypothetical protein CVT78_10440 [Alphaproteobacteria bacterium HGW-Alphaproteobacteria-17]|nr:MAG: hypothetical protein CVT78_10440 [Alphaproteobacteria bacterium HGW-Alphaproteobacteria-17]